jgi:gliding motility-associated-like protein
MGISPTHTTLSYSTVMFTDLTQGEIIAWDWAFGDGFGTNQQNPTYQYPNLGNYEVILKVTDINGCQDTVHGYVIIDVDFEIWIPNAFTPNEDGRNDLWKPKAVGYSEEDYLLQIYDRWGKKIFETTDFHKYWDASLNNSKVENTTQSIYVYSIQIKDNMNIIHHYKGTITLVY